MLQSVDAWEKRSNEPLSYLSMLLREKCTLVMGVFDIFSVKMMHHDYNTLSF